MAETLITGHELILKVYDEEGGDLLYTEGFSQEPNMDVDEYLAEHNISLSGNAEIELYCELLEEQREGILPNNSFQQILSGYQGCYTCTQVDADAGKCTLGEQTCRTRLEIPATVEMRVYGAFKKENNQHGAIFTWHSVRDDGYSAMRGPCPEGFHVPSKDEWTGLGTIMDGLLLTTGADWKINLHLPFSGQRSGSTSDVGYQGTYGDYSSISTSTVHVENTLGLRLTSSGKNTQVDFVKATAHPIRGFKNIYATPTSGRTVITGTLGSAGVFWNQSEGLISITDGATGYTIMDKNIGATAVYNNGDTLSEANCGGYFQWGNNYMFPFTGNITTTSSAQVDASGYAPSTYSSSTFITWSGDWSSPSNPNLRGGETGVQSGYKLLHKEFYTDYSAMRGPCPEGFHVPSSSEGNLLCEKATTLFGTNAQQKRTYLMLPGSLYLDSVTGDRVSGNYTGGVLCCDCYLQSQNPKPYRLGWQNTNNNYSLYMARLSTGEACAYPIRPFKDIPVIPEGDREKIFDGSSVASGAGVRHNATLGLISISTDGITRLTLMDKNLGATQIYTDGADPSSDNCGYYFQWGNNNPFSFDGASIKSSTLVDVSGYGPGNYYNSPTFIVTSSSTTGDNPRWISSAAVPNLRGGVTGVVERGRRVI